MRETAQGGGRPCRRGTWNRIVDSGEVASRAWEAARTEEPAVRSPAGAARTKPAVAVVRTSLGAGHTILAGDRTIPGAAVRAEVVRMADSVAAVDTRTKDIAAAAADLGTRWNQTSSKRSRPTVAILRLLVGRILRVLARHDGIREESLGPVVHGLALFEGRVEKFHMI